MEINSIRAAFQTKLRLAIISALITGAKTFKELKAVTAASDGNLGAQLSKLEALGYLVCKKEFVNKKPQSTYIITEKGMNQFREYVEMLEELLHQSEKEC